MSLIDWINNWFRPKPPVTTTTSAPKTTTTAAPGPITGEISQLLAAHNAERTQRGSTALRIEMRLSAAAQGHANWMASRGTMSHAGFPKRVTDAGYKYGNVGENVAYGYADVAAVMRGWMRSPGHRANILGRFTEIGLGVARRGDTPYWCAIFATPANFAVPANESIYAAGGIGIDEAGHEYIDDQAHGSEN